MDNNNNNGIHHQQQQQHQQQQPQSTNTTQQFCLRWHNHQTSLLSSLPLLLDQSHLTDVTLSAEGRTVRAHRVVLSACSTFFSELFRTLEPPFHPVIVLPGASFGAMVALLTFMYSGEVNVFEEQITSLLSLAETLGIKGLADFNGNVSKSSPPKCDTPVSAKEPETPSPTLTPTTTPTPTKLVSPLENLFANTFKFCPELMGNPLNFSQSAISRGAEIFARYQNQCRINQQFESGKFNDNNSVDENGNRKSSSTPTNLDAKKSKLTDMRKIDKIAEHLRSGGATTKSMGTCKSGSEQSSRMSPSRSHTPPTSLILKPPPFSALAHFMASGGAGNAGLSDDNLSKSTDNLLMDTQKPGSSSFHHGGDVGLSMNSAVESLLDKSLPPITPTKTSNSKLYATCFICHKQLSNQYNLRVHLETHQNVRYACNVCSHVSRSKDALRKHVSYRHPGAPSPCESEAKRKRTKAAAAAAAVHQQQQQQQQHHQMLQQSIKQEFSGPSQPLQPSTSTQSTLQQQLSSQVFQSSVKLEPAPTALQHHLTNPLPTPYPQSHDSNSLNLSSKPISDLSSSSSTSQKHETLLESIKSSLAAAAAAAATASTTHQQPQQQPQSQHQHQCSQNN